MKLDEYQRRAAETAVYPNTYEHEALKYLVPKLMAEVGELAEIMAAAAMRRQSPDLPKLSDELGDILWYVSEIARSAAGTTLSEVAQRNLDKLARRAAAGALTDREVR